MLDFKNEFHKQGIIPLLILKDRDDNITVPLFTNFRTAYSFMKRNLRKKVIAGIVELIDKKLENMKQKGWTLEVMNWSRKFIDHPIYKLDFEIYEMSGDTEFRALQ